MLKPFFLLVLVLFSGSNQYNRTEHLKGLQYNQWKFTLAATKLGVTLQLLLQSKSPNAEGWVHDMLQASYCYVCASVRGDRLQ